jgi:hypothetical protein
MVAGSIVGSAVMETLYCILGIWNFLFGIWIVEWLIS